jgi:hypothetical protein
MDTVRGRGVDMGQGYHRRVLGSSYQVVQAVRGAHTRDRPPPLQLRARACTRTHACISRPPLV